MPMYEPQFLDFIRFWCIFCMVFFAWRVQIAGGRLCFAACNSVNQTCSTSTLLCIVLMYSSNSCIFLVVVWSWEWAWCKPTQETLSGVPVDYDDQRCSCRDSWGTAKRTCCRWRTHYSQERLNLVVRFINSHCRKWNCIIVKLVYF